MTKLTLQDYWQPEDDAAAIVDKWTAEDNANIPPEVRESLREFFPRIDLSPDEADVIPQSVARYITTNSRAYQKYMKERSERTSPDGLITCKSPFEEVFLLHLQGLYAILEFYDEFVESVKSARQAKAVYVDAAEAKISLELLGKKPELLSKTKEDEKLMLFLTEIDKSLRMFESLVPVDVVRYIGHAGYRIAGDTAETYRAVPELVKLQDLKKRAEELFYRFGYVRGERNLFVPKEVDG
ncbi:MAG: hypothetical protein FWB75_04475 [Oscillospiraceae bacterium]|nr:hypothetical protein [Oscillospiraceae bacterium]